MSDSSATDPQTVVDVTGVNHYYGTGDARKQALADNHLQVRAGEIVIMTGPSGSGKTSLLTLIGALRGVQEGSIKLWGHELAGMDAKAQIAMRRRIGFIFQAHNLLEALTAQQNVRLALELAQLSAADETATANAMLTSLGLADRIHYKPRNLSGGQRQRVAIGRALVHQPGLILADEPTAALDKDSGANVVKLLRELADNHGCAVMIVTHDNRILNVADRIVNMVDGRIVSDINLKRTMFICGILRNCEVFKAMSASDLNDVAQKMEEEKVTAGTTIIQQGDVGDKFYVLGQGTVEIEIAVAEGGSRAVARLETGAFFGEVALLRDQPRNATVVAETDCVLYTLSKPEFKAAIAQHRSFEDQLMAQLVARGG